MLIQLCTSTRTRSNIDQTKLVIYIEKSQITNRCIIRIAYFFIIYGPMVVRESSTYYINCVI